MAAPAGATVGIVPFDLGLSDMPPPEPGDVVVSEGRRGYGTAYLVTQARLMARSAHPRRYALRCVVLGPAESAPIGADARIFSLVWYRRDRKRGV